MTLGNKGTWVIELRQRGKPLAYHYWYHSRGCDKPEAAARAWLKKHKAKTMTQFWVAVLSVCFVGCVVLLLTWGSIFHDVDPAIAMAAYAGLTGVAGQAAAWLFRNKSNSVPK